MDSLQCSLLHTCLVERWGSRDGMVAHAQHLVRPSTCVSEYRAEMGAGEWQLLLHTDPTVSDSRGNAINYQSMQNDLAI